MGSSGGGELITTLATNDAEYFSDAFSNDTILASSSPTPTTRVLLGFGNSEDYPSNQRSVLRLEQGNNVSFDYFTSENDGRVLGSLGVGTLYPECRVDIRGDMVRLQGNGDTLFVAFTSNVSGEASLMCVSSYDGNDIDNTCEFGCSAASGTFIGYGGQHRINIDKMGYVGVGTSSPDRLLHVAGDARSDGTLVSSNLQVDGSSYKLGDNTPALRVIGTRSRDNKPVAEFSTKTSINEDQFSVANIIMTVNGANDGRVGVRTNNPQHVLHVDGNVFTTGQYLMSSDARLKTDLSVMEHSLERLKLLTGYTYSRKLQNEDEEEDEKKGKQKRYAGLLAQDVQGVFPEAVEEQEDGYLSIAYGNLLAFVIEAVKDVDNKLNSVINLVQQERK
jgi:hypothetical protein